MHVTLILAAAQATGQASSDWTDTVVAITSVVSIAVATIALLETRTSSRIARVEAYPVALQEGAFLGIRLENFGPSYARDVRLMAIAKQPRSWLKGGNDVYRTAISLAVLPVGTPYTVEIGQSFKDGTRTAVVFLESKAPNIDVRWSWRDGRRRLLWRNPRGHSNYRVGQLLQTFRLLPREPDPAPAPVDGGTTATADAVRPPGIIAWFKRLFEPDGN
jgi:hypothetical protein